jgi:hypothetical protein
MKTRTDRACVTHHAAVCRLPECYVLRREDLRLVGLRSFDIGRWHSLRPCMGRLFVAAVLSSGLLLFVRRLNCFLALYTENKMDTVIGVQYDGGGMLREGIWQPKLRLSGVN